MDYNAKLCYVMDGVAYFTTQDLDKQWGDDWDDAPYEYNAGEPYEEEYYKIYKIHFDKAALDTPCSDHHNSPFSVKDINAGAVAWLRHPEGNLQAGATVSEFIEYIKKIGSNYYLPADWVEDMLFGFVWVLDCLVPSGLDNAMGTEYIEEVPPNWWVYDLVSEYLSSPVYHGESWSDEDSPHKDQFCTTKHEDNTNNVKKRKTKEI